MKKLEGKTSIITGAGSGLGRAIAIAFARRGATVMVSDIVRESAEATRGMIAGSGGQAYSLHVDVTSEESVKNLMNCAAAQLGHIDILVNNAGIELIKEIEAISFEEWQRVIAVNVHGVFLCCKHVLPHMKKAGRGMIINMGSTAGVTGAPFQSAYCASKGAVHQLTKALASECGAAGIQVNAIAPGPVYTPMYDYLQEGFGKFGFNVRSITDKLFGGTQQPEDIANMAVFLASGEARTVHGAVLIVDGGQTAGPASVP